jgi:DNA-binding response OmpR family regulator
VVSIDTDKVEKIVVNLLSNAFKYTSEGGSIHLRLNVVESAGMNLNTVYEQYFEVCVEDTGAGISEEKLRLIFEKYYTSDSEVMDATNSGIGLSYTKDLVYLMQGEIRVTSQVGIGTEFRVYLPLISVREVTTSSPASLDRMGLNLAKQEASLLLSSYTEQNEDAPPAQADTRHELPRILVVEDHDDMRHFLERILSVNYRVLGAANGKEGLKMAQSQTIDLIICDVMMPEMDGFAFCDAIKSNLVTSHIPIILLTAKMLEEDRMSGFVKGADDYITKPFNPDLLLVRVENLLQLRSHLRDVFNKDYLLTPKTEEVTSPDEEFLQRLVDIMNEGLSDADFNVDRMCKMVFLSHMHFIRKVKQLTGKKPVDLLKTFRMRKAKELLIQDKLTIAEVAYKVGFSLPNSFSRAFKKEFNITPTEYVQSIQRQGSDDDSGFEPEMFSIN